jgi:hypothetical protein
MKITKDGFTYYVYLKEKVDHLKGTWYLWACDVETPSGNWHSDATIEGDLNGNLIAEETLEFV